MTTRPKNSKSAPAKKQQRLKLFLKPTDPEGGQESYYRFRLLCFTDSTKNDRDDSVIIRYVHRVFGKNEDGKTIVAGEVVCPVTKFAQWDGNPYKDCKICNYAGRQFNEYNKSGKTDREAIRKNREFSRKYEAWVPVYVVNDPVYETNNGKLMAFCFTDKKQYEAFDSLCRKAERESSIYNENAVDFYLKLGEVTKIINEGKPDEHPWTTTEIKKMGFTKREYPIDAITDSALSEFEFDEQLYKFSTREEIDEFYDKFCKPQSVGDIPDDDMEMIDVSSSPKDEKPAAKTKSVEPDDIEDTPPPKEEPAKKPADDFEADLDAEFDSPPPEKKPVKEEPKEEEPAPAKEAAKPVKKAETVSMEELDSLLSF